MTDNREPRGVRPSRTNRRQRGFDDNYYQGATEPGLEGSLEYGEAHTPQSWNKPRYPGPHHTQGSLALFDLPSHSYGQYENPGAFAEANSANYTHQSNHTVFEPQYRTQNSYHAVQTSPRGQFDNRQQYMGEGNSAVYDSQPSVQSQFDPPNHVSGGGSINYLMPPAGHRELASPRHTRRPRNHSRGQLDTLPTPDTDPFTGEPIYFDPRHGAYADDQHSFEQRPQRTTRHAPSTHSKYTISNAQSPDTRTLDPRYTVHRSNYFVVGKVFALLWHENHGRGLEGTYLSSAQTPFRGKFGEPIYSTIRRMVIVRSFENCCWCLPISTYSNQGVSKQGVEVSRHAVIYMQNTEPCVLESEPPMTKEPLAVVPDSLDEKLDPMSRLNFGKIYTVEHNVRVLPIGRIAPESMPKFRNYAAREITVEDSS